MDAVAVAGRNPLHRLSAPLYAWTSCGLSMAPGTVRRISITPGRNDLCRVCFPDVRSRVIRLGRRQREVVRRALESTLHRVIPRDSDEREATWALAARGILVPVDGLPGVYRISSAELAIHLKGAVLQHRED